MGAALYGGAKTQFLSTGLSLLTNNIKVVLVDLDDYGDAITDATNVTPIVVTSAAHGYANGERVCIQGVGGNTAANGTFIAANVATNTYELTDLDGVNVAGNGAYTSGGTGVNVDVDDFLNDVPTASRVATSANLVSPTVATPFGGIFDAANFTYSSVSGDVSEALIAFNDTPAPETAKDLIAFFGSDVVTNLPVTPNSGDIQVNWDGTRYRIFGI